MVATIYVVNWSPDSVGGLEWNVDRTTAERFRRELADPTARLHVVKVPAELTTADSDTITDWLDADGWSDGVDPRRVIV